MSVPGTAPSTAPLWNAVFHPSEPSTSHVMSSGPHWAPKEMPVIEDTRVRPSDAYPCMPTSSVRERVPVESSAATPPPDPNVCKAAEDVPVITGARLLEEAEGLRESVSPGHRPGDVRILRVAALLERLAPGVGRTCARPVTWSTPRQTARADHLRVQGGERGPLWVQKGVDTG